MPPKIRDVVVETKYFSDKYAGDIEWFGFNWIKQVPLSNIVPSVEVTLIVEEGVDENVQDMLDGPPVIDNKRTIQKIKGGVPNVVYRLFMTVPGEAVASAVFKVVEDPSN